MAKELAIKGVLGSIVEGLDNEVKEVIADVKSEVDTDIETVDIGLDIGASSVKISFYNRDKIIVDLDFSNSVDPNLITGDGTIVTVDDVSIKLDSTSGNSNSVDKKINYEYFDNIIFNVAHQVKKALNIKGDIRLNVSTCLPPEQYREFKEDYKELIAGVDGKTGTVGNEEFTLYIGDVKCGAEGIMLLKSFDLDGAAKDIIRAMLIDMGSSTADIVLLEKHRDTWRVKNARTSEYASRKMCQDIVRGINADNKKANVKWQDLDRGAKYQLKGKVYSIVDRANDVDETVKGLIADVNRVGSFEENKIILCGQGSDILANNDLFKNTADFIQVDEINKKFGNSRGCLKVIN